MVVMRSEVNFNLVEVWRRTHSKRQLACLDSESRVYSPLKTVVLANRYQRTMGVGTCTQEFPKQESGLKRKQAYTKKCGESVKETVTRPLAPSSAPHQRPNHLAGGLRLKFGREGGEASSTTTSTAVVRGIPVEVDGETGSGVGKAAGRVLAGCGTVTVSAGRVWVMVLISGSYS
jgi:hypothetical protein